MSTPGRVNSAYALAGAAIALAAMTIVIQWELERLGGGWTMIIRENLSVRLPESSGGQVLVQSLLRLSGMVWPASGIAFGMAVVAIALGWRQAGVRWLSSAGVFLVAVTVYMRLAWENYLRWS